MNDVENLLKMDPNLKSSPKNKSVFIFFGKAVTTSNLLDIFKIARDNIDRDKLIDFVKKINKPEFEALIYPSGRFQMMIDAQKLYSDQMIYADATDDEDKAYYQKIKKYIPKMSSSLEKLKNIKTPDEKEFESRSECFKLFQSSWLNPKQGPIIASLCFLPCYFKEATYAQMEEAWKEISLQIKEKGDPVDVYDKLIYSNYTYCTDAYNFLLEYHKSGICNCECGSFLFYLLKRDSFLFVEHGHIFVGFDLEKGFETTKNEVVSIDSENIQFGFYSEQTVGIYILFFANRYHNTTFIFTEMLNIDAEDRDIVNSLLKCNRKAVKTLLDSNSFDIIILQSLCYFQKRLINFEGLIELNKKYFKSDVSDILKGVVYTEKDFIKRMEQFTSTLGQFIKS